MRTGHLLPFLPLVLALAVASGGGCQTGGRTDRTVYEGPPPAAASDLRLDVVNPSGAVTVVADPTATQVLVRTRVRINRHVARDRALELLERPWAIAQTAELGPGQQELRISVDDIASEEPGAQVDLTVTLPSATGVRIRSDAGPVDLLGVGGDIDVQAGLYQRGGGPVLVRTARAIDRPISLSSTAGDVVLVLGPRARGAFDLAAREGQVRSLPRGVRVENVVAGDRSWRGVIAGGDNPVVLRTRQGDVRLLVREDPEAYRPRP